MIKKEKNLQSRELQVNARKGLEPNLQSDYNTVKVGNKIVGKVIGNEFVKKVHSSRHFLKKPEAIAFDVQTIHQALSLGATRLKILDLDTGVIYTVTISLIFSNGFYFNRGYGEQIGLSLDYWQKVKKDSAQNLPTPPKRNAFHKRSGLPQSSSSDAVNQPQLWM